MENLLQMNWLAMLVAALMPLAIGSLWYNDRLLGSRWIRETGLTTDQLKSGNMGVLFGVTFLLSFLLAFAVNFLVIHQYGVIGTLLGKPGIAETSEEFQLAKSILEKYGTNFRTFQHGFLHGVMDAIVVVLPILGINSLFERKSWTYILIHIGYWIITLGLMGGIICAWI